MDDAQLESAGLLEGVQGEAARAQRLDLLRQLIADGFSLGELQEATRAERLALLPVDRILHREDVRYTRVELAELSGLPLEFLRRLWRGPGPPHPPPPHALFCGPP